MYKLGISLLIIGLASSIEVSDTSTDVLTQKNDSADLIMAQDDIPIDIPIDEIPVSIPTEKTDDPSTDSNATIISDPASNSTLKLYTSHLADQIYDTVEIVNETRLIELLKLAAPINRTDTTSSGKAQAKICLLVLFYARWCVFSAYVAPHYNALPRYFPRIKTVAIDVSQYQNFNTQFGIIGVPTLMFVYNGKPFATFNDTVYSLEKFARFVTKYTDLEPGGAMYLDASDFYGPLPNRASVETDYCLVASWVFIATCAIYFTFQSRWWRLFVELVQNTWRESNAQHEHIE